MKRTIAPVLLGLAMLWSAAAAEARIKLTALPKRERVEIQLDNGRFTLVEEERIVPLLRSSAETGNNHIDFSWSNTRIDKNSILFRPLAVRERGTFRPLAKVDGLDEVAVINVSYPPNENALVWEVYAARACALKVRVSYLIGNLTRTFAYRALAGKEETSLILRCYLRLRNYSGEAFGTAGVWAGFGKKFQKQVGQQEEIKMLLHRFPEVSVRKTFTFDWYANGPLNAAKPLASRILMHYKMTNDKARGLGLFPLQPGKVRIFIEDGHGGQAFLGEDLAGFTPLDDAMRLYLGESRDIVCTRTIERNLRHTIRGNLFNQELIVKYEIENFKDKGCVLDICERINRLAQQYGRRPHGDAEWDPGKESSRNFRTSFEEGRTMPFLHVKLPPRPRNPKEKVKKTVVRFHLIIKNLW
jgi:hypothetical protein